MLTDFVLGTSPRQLARKSNPCRGASARSHAHFFTKDGEFGSLDENGNQVDDGTYRVVTDNAFSIAGDPERGVARFTYRILRGDTLILHPVITRAARRRALAHPLEWSPAGWQVAVSYEGLPWKRVSCDGWC
jgi:hypothetical protein